MPHTAFAPLREVAEQPHLKAVGLFEQIDHPSEGKLLQARPPARFSATPASVHRLSPQLGQHTREVLQEVGYPEADIDKLIDNKAVVAAERQPTDEEGIQ